MQDSPVCITAREGGDRYGVCDSRSVTRIVLQIMLYACTCLFQGAIHECDLLRLRPSSSVDSCGGAVWCMAINSSKTNLAAGCEDGQVLLASVFIPCCLMTFTSCTCAGAAF